MSAQTPMRAALFSLAISIALSLSAAVAHTAEVIHSFDSVVQLAGDGTLTVTETLRVRAEGREIKRGIYRDFPLTFKDAGGNLREVSFSLLGVTRDGKPEPHFTKRNGNILRIYAGNKDVLIARGDHTYVFRYQTARQLRWFDGKPELNWNVTGNFWNFPISTATYRLELADSARPLRWSAFTGRLGARGTDWRGAIDNAGVLTVATTRPLAAGEGITVVAELPESSVARPGPATELWYSIRDNRRWIFGGLGFVLVLAYYLAAWNAVGRDPKTGTIIPLFHPPAGVSPALANYIDNWGFGREKWRAFTAAALSLAVRGLIKFDNSDGKLTLTEKKRDAASSAALPSGENAIFSWVKEHGGNAIIDRAHGSAVATVGGEFTSSIESESRNRFFRRNLGYAITGLLLTAAVVAGVIVFGRLQDEDISILVVMVFGSFMLGMFLVPLLVSLFGGDRAHVLIRGVMTIAVAGIFTSIFVNIVVAVFPNGIGDVLPILWSFIAAYPFPFVLLPGFAALNGLFFYLMRAPTALGRPIMDQLAGFKLYLETAEVDRLNMQAPEITADRFEALLPYAVALNLEKPWSDAFAAALSRAYPGDANPMQHYRPNWTSGSSSWSGGDFGTAVAATVGSVSGALASAVPVSSGSSGFSGGGGGGSGGGGGGGGGGGW